MNTVTHTPTVAQSAAAVLAFRNETTNRVGPLYGNETAQLARLLNTRTVRNSLATTNSAEQLEEDVAHATRNWSHQELASAATAIVYQAENRHVRKWVYFSKDDLRYEIGASLTRALCKGGWVPSDL